MSKSDHQNETMPANKQPSIFSALDPDPSPACCGKAMEPRTAKARDESGQAEFLTVWSCRECGKRAL
jgi:hypothetical protein